MTRTYVDTGILVKLYSAEVNSAEAVALVARYAPPLPLTIWQELELRTALRVRLFRKEITCSALDDALERVNEDLNEGRWERPAVDLPEVHRRAERLSAEYAAEIGCRTLDTLHVAAALTVNVRDLVTFDRRQQTLGKRVGLNVLPNLNGQR